MGAIHQPPLSALALELSRVAGLRDFVETGTFMGHALDWAGSHFERVWTIEIDPRYQAAARERNARHPNIRYLLGNSAVELGRLCLQLDRPALFWLDAHAGAGYFAPEDNCPLLDELTAVMRSPYAHCVLVDDARAFLAPPPPPFNYVKWPALEDVFGAIAVRADYHAVIIADTLIVVPRALREVIARFCFQVRPSI